MFFDAQPLFMIDLIFCDFLLVFCVHLEYAFVYHAEFALVANVILKLDFLLLTVLITISILISTTMSIQIGLCCFVKTLEKALID